MSLSPRVAVVIGSTRPIRISTHIAAWVRDRLAKNSELTYELLDLAEVELPFLDEPIRAALGHPYTHEHTRAWSQLVSQYDGFVFVSPQFNWGYPAVLKNALDYLYDEWRDKAATVVTHGTYGGGKAADQLIEVLTGLHMRILPDHVRAVITDEDRGADWQLIDVDKTLGPIADQLRTIDAQFAEALDAKALDRVGGIA